MSFMRVSRHWSCREPKVSDGGMQSIETGHIQQSPTARKMARHPEEAPFRHDRRKHGRLEALPFDTLDTRLR
jgi:hypothetical protein